MSSTEPVDAPNVPTADDVGGGNRNSDQTGVDGDADAPAGRFRRLLRLIGLQAAGGAIVGVLTAAAVFLATTSVDDRRSEREEQRSREFTWRQNLASDAHYPAADLSDLNLQGLYASNLDLSGSNLRTANLSGSTLTHLQLDGAILAEADLSGSNLDGASLQGVVATDADFTESSLERADLRFASVAGADLRGCPGVC